MVLLTATAFTVRAAPPRMSGSYQSPFAQDSLSLLFPSPVLRVGLADALPARTLDALEEAVLGSWHEHLAEQATLPQTDARTGTEGGRLRARTDQERNEEFFYYQRENFGVDGLYSEPRGWLASEAAQHLLGAVAAAATGYIESIAHHAGLDTDGEWSVDPDRLQVWASVHQGGSTHPRCAPPHRSASRLGPTSRRGCARVSRRHVHVGAVASGVFYVRAPEGAGKICFFDPRGAIPPFEREVRHRPQRGELILVPPWLSHAVASSATGAPPAAPPTPPTHTHTPHPCALPVPEFL